jgi:tetratricopeptide (TPR) repeat protein
VPWTPAAQIAAARLTQAVSERRSPASLASYGTALLIARRPAEAVAALEEAVRTGPPSASMWSDLGTAYLARAAAATQSIDLPRALDAVDQALALARLPEAAFTRSLVLERLDRRADAAAAWKQYLALDSSSPWAAEARAHLQALETR